MNVDGGGHRAPGGHRRAGQGARGLADSPSYPGVLQHAVNTAVRARPARTSGSTPYPRISRLQPQGHRTSSPTWCSSAGRASGWRAEPVASYTGDPMTAAELVRAPATRAAAGASPAAARRAAAARLGGGLAVLAADRVPEHVHHLRPGFAVQRQPGGHDPGQDTATPAAIARLNHALGPRPAADRAVLALAEPGAAGRPRPVSGSLRSRSAQSIAQRLPVDLSIALLAVVLAALLGGTARHGRRGPPGRLVRPRGHARSARPVSTLPAFVVGIVLVVLFAVTVHRAARRTGTSARPPASRSGSSTSSCPAWR